MPQSSSVLHMLVIIMHRVYSEVLLGHTTVFEFLGTPTNIEFSWDLDTRLWTVHVGLLQF